MQVKFTCRGKYCNLASEVLHIMGFFVVVVASASPAKQRTLYILLEGAWNILEDT